MANAFPEYASDDPVYEKYIRSYLVNTGISEKTRPKIPEPSAMVQMESRFLPQPWE
jgi:hypothetical protein